MLSQFSFERLKLPAELIRSFLSFNATGNVWIFFEFAMNFHIFTNKFNWWNNCLTQNSNEHFNKIFINLSHFIKQSVDSLYSAVPLVVLGKNLYFNSYTANESASCWFVLYTADVDVFFVVVLFSVSFSLNNKWNVLNDIALLW